MASCITDATGGAGSYSIDQFFDYNETAATLAVVFACLLMPVTLYLGRKQRMMLRSTPVSGIGVQQLKEWYATLALFPSVAAVGCWLSICLPNLGILFEVCYEVFEAICLTRFAFILLVLINGGVRVLDRYLEVPNDQGGGVRGISGILEMMSIYYPMIRTDSFIAATQKNMDPEVEKSRSRSNSVALLDVDERGVERKPHPIGKVLVLVYQFVILGPLFVFLDLVCSYSGSAEGESLAQVFNFLKLISTVVAMISLVSLVLESWDILPQGSNIHGKLITIKLMVVFGTMQGIIIALLIQCTPQKHHTTFPAAIAAQTWQSIIFLFELPCLQMMFNKAYPASDFSDIFGADTGVSFFDPNTPTSPTTVSNGKKDNNIDQSPLLS